MLTDKMDLRLTTLRMAISCIESERVTSEDYTELAEKFYEFITKKEVSNKRSINVGKSKKVVKKT